MKIMQILRAPVGGLFRHVVDLTCSLSARNFEVGIIVDNLAGGQAATEKLIALEPLCSLGIHRFSMHRMPHPSDLKVIKNIQQILDEKNVDICHGHGAKGGFYTRLSCKKNQQKAIYTPHGGSLHYSWLSPFGFAFLMAERMMVAKTDHFIFESAYGKRVFEDKICVDLHNATVALNGLSAAEFTPAHKHDQQPGYDFVFVGEMRDLKGVDLLLYALKGLINQENRPASLYLAGDGPDMAKFQKMAQNLNLNDRVHFAGQQPANEAFAQGKTLILSSRAESLPYVLLEAVAASMPVIATNVGGVREIFGPTSDQLIQANSSDALHHAMAASLCYEEAMRSQAKIRLDYIKENFTLNNMVDIIVQVYGR